MTKMPGLDPYYGYAIYPFYCHHIDLRDDTPWTDITKAENVNDLFFSNYISELESNQKITIYHCELDHLPEEMIRDLGSGDDLGRTLESVYMYRFSTGFSYLVFLFAYSGGDAPSVRKDINHLRQFRKIEVLRSFMDTCLCSCMTQRQIKFGEKIGTAYDDIDDDIYFFPGVLQEGYYFLIGTQEAEQDLSVKQLISNIKVDIAGTPRDNTIRILYKNENGRLNNRRDLAYCKRELAMVDTYCPSDFDESQRIKTKKNIGEQYLLLYLLVIHEHQALSRFANLAVGGLNDESRSYVQLKSDLEEFRACYYYSWISDEPRYQLPYQELSRYFGNEKLENNVNAVIAQLEEGERKRAEEESQREEAEESERERQLNLLLAIIAILAVISTASDVISLVNVFRQHTLPTGTAVLIIVAVPLVVLLIFYVILSRLRKKK